MRLTLIRHATLLLELGQTCVLVDPMLAPAEAAPPVEGTAPALRNPRVELPLPAAEIVARAAVVLVTHLHNDHFDGAARELLAPDVPMACQPADVGMLSEHGFTALMPVDDTAQTHSLTFRRRDARHSLGEHEAALAPVSSFAITGRDGRTILVAGDCVWCDELAATIDDIEPDVIVVNAGAARFLTGAAITMTADDVIAAARHAPAAVVVAVHLEAINHCPMSRAELRRHLVAAGLDSQVRIPADGEALDLPPR